ncbi:COP9 signalosome complex subunit 3 [Nymphaea colorata]|nr:COP9 signalosome complex subunit 3 [Nymphaea colorata]
MDSVESLITHIQGLSGCPEDVSHLHSLLKQEEDSLQSQGSRLGSFLHLLDPSKHSLGYLYFLEAHTSGSVVKEEASGFLNIVANFINACSAEQIQVAPDKFVSICKRFKEQVMQLQVPIQGIAPLLVAIRKLQPSPEHLTALHPDFLLLCLLAKCYKAGLSILNDDISEIDQPKDFFLYCYYGGMIYIGLKRFHKALEFLRHATTSPMPAIHAVAVEAYKKYILVSLIQNGQLPNFPKYTSSAAQRYLKLYSQPYVDLASSYGTGKISELQSCFNSNVEKFKNDNNVGLVKQVLSSLYKRNIQRLTQTYLTLSLQDIANTVELEDAKQAEMHVLQMIQDGEIFATINQKDGMVSFHEDPEQYKTCEMIQHLDSSIARIMGISKKLKAVEESIACDPSYVTKAGRERTRLDFDDFDSVPQKFLV